MKMTMKMKEKKSERINNLDKVTMTMKKKEKESEKSSKIMTNHKILNN